MRVYEFARKIGATSASVMRMAEEAEVEVYSPLSEIDEGDLEALNQRYLQVGPSVVKADADAIAARRAEKVARAAAIQAEKDKAQAVALEAARQRAIAAAEGRSAEPPPKAPEKEKPIEIKVTLPELPKVTIQVSEDDPHADEDEPLAKNARGRHDDDDVDDDDDDADAYVQSKARDKRTAAAKQHPSQKQQQAAARQAAAKQPQPPPPPPPPPPKPEPKKPAAPARPPSTRVGGLRAGFSSVSMRLSRPQTTVISTGSGSKTPAAPIQPHTLCPTYMAVLPAMSPGTICSTGSSSTSSPSRIHLSFWEKTRSATARMAYPPPTTKRAILNISQKSVSAVLNLLDIILPAQLSRSGAGRGA